MSTKKQTTPKKKNKVASIIIDVVLVLAIIFFAFVSYSAYAAKTGDSLPGIFGLHMTSVLTNSMSPTFKQGDMTFCTTVKDASKLKVDDVITFWTVIDGEKAVNTHRIVEIIDGGTFLSFRTKGDANTINDSLTVHESSIIGKYQFHIVGLGSVFQFLQTGNGFLIVIVIPVAIFFLWQLIQFMRALFAYQAEKVRIQFAAENGIAHRDPDDEEEESKKKTDSKDEPKKKTDSEDGEKKE